MLSLTLGDGLHPHARVKSLSSQISPLVRALVFHVQLPSVQIYPNVSCTVLIPPKHASLGTLHLYASPGRLTDYPDTVL